MSHRIIPAIMSGGSGTRLWPASTDQLPKQFHALLGGESLIIQTALRVAGEANGLSFAPPIVLCNAQHQTLTHAHLARAGIKPAAMALEPFGRNTAAAGVLAAALGAELDPNALVLLLPADHVIADQGGFHAAIARAAPFAQDRIVTFGIEPDNPATGYGYIKSGALLGDGVFEIAAFKEKPDAELAQTYLDEGGYSWNAGIFLFKPSVLLAEFAASADIRDRTLAALRAAPRDGANIALSADAFGEIPSLPIDIAVMEKTARGAVAPCAFGWADVGSWDEVWRLSARDAQDNALIGPAAALDSRGNLLHSSGPKICVAGIEDLIVVATADAIIVLPRARAQDVKALLQEAKKLEPNPDPKPD
jgi:mannose-1-phosphate guanylyltransferase/mannose-6-phosphate isomerase